MAIAIQVPGACLIKLDTGSSHALESLGYSENGVHIEEEIFTEGVPGDLRGGDLGPPIDIQYFGEIHRVRLELSSWDSAVAAKVNPVLYGGTEGQSGAPGSLFRAGGFSFRLLLLCTNLPRNYPIAFLRGAPKEINKGTKFSRLILNFECHDQGVSTAIWNTTTS